MAEIVLIRHGQASFGTSNYDRLSELGWSQAVWLGEYLRQLDRGCDRIVTGTMSRHHQTTEGLLNGLGSDLQPDIHAGLNEYSFRGLLTPLMEQFPDKWAETGHARRDYYKNMRRALGYWMDGTIQTDGNDSWAGFCQRTREAFSFACEGESKRVLLVTSGGPIAVILGQVLGLDDRRIRDMTLQIKNSSTSTLLYNRVDLTLDSFNDVSHLQTADRQKYITFS